MADKLSKPNTLYVLMQEVDGKLEFFRGDPAGKKWNSGKRRNIRVFPTIGLAEAGKKQNSAGDDVQIVEFVPKLMGLREDPYNWSWEDLEDVLSVFDHVDVTFTDGAVHPMFGGSSGVTVLRVTDVGPVKQAGGKVLLHVSTDTNWFGPGVNRIFSDDYITKIIDDTVAEFEFSGNTPNMDAAEKLKKAFGVGREAMPRMSPRNK